MLHELFNYYITFTCTERQSLLFTVIQTFNTLSRLPSIPVWVLRMRESGRPVLINPKFETNSNSGFWSKLYSKTVRINTTQTFVWSNMAKTQLSKVWIKTSKPHACRRQSPLHGDVTPLSWTAPINAQIKSTFRKWVERFHYQKGESG